MNYKGTKDQKHFCLFCGAEIQFRNYRNAHKYCGYKCQAAHRSQTRLQRDKVLFEQGKLKYRRNIYEILTEKYNNTCSICGISSWNGKPLKMWVDHIDGNATNNLPENFRLVCPNCDCQSPTFGARNKGNGRKSHGIKSYG